MFDDFDTQIQIDEWEAIYEGEFRQEDFQEDWD